MRVEIMRFSSRVAHTELVTTSCTTFVTWTDIAAALFVGGGTSSGAVFVMEPASSVSRSASTPSWGADSAAAQSAASAAAKMR